MADPTAPVAVRVDRSRAGSSVVERWCAALPRCVFVDAAGEAFGLRRGSDRRGATERRCDRREVGTDQRLSVPVFWGCASLAGASRFIWVRALAARAIPLVMATLWASA